MAKIKKVEYKHDGKVFKTQYMYFCMGCGYEHAFGLISEDGNHKFNGDLNNPTVSPSLVQGWVAGQRCHSYIKNGMIEYLSDCWHKLKGQTIELPEIEETPGKMKTLVELFAEKGSKYYKTDKGTDHDYLKVYDELFAPFKDKEINIFEVGFYLGGSIRLWEDYFTKAQIRCIDINPKCKLLSLYDRSTLEIMDVMNLTTDYFENFPPDIAIDDSFHTLEGQLHFIKVVYPALRKGGLLIVEDIIDIDRYRDSFLELGIPFEMIDRREEVGRSDEILLIFRK
jgi:hypothetical protein